MIPIGIIAILTNIRIICRLIPRVLFEIIPLTYWSCATLLNYVVLVAVVYCVHAHFVVLLEMRIR